MIWFNLALIFLAAAGFAAWVITIVNRIHSRPLSNRVLHLIRVWHDSLIFGYPLLLMIGTGLGDNGLLQGGDWYRLQIEWKCLYLFGWIGAIGTLAHAWAYLLAAPPASKIRSEYRKMNVENELGFRPDGNGPYQSFLKVPFNEVFLLEISTHEFALPNFPPEWDGLSILHLSDWHFSGTIDLPYFEYVARRAQEMQPDLVVFTGDLLDAQELEKWIPPTLGTLSAPLGKYFILGNHDWYLDAGRTRESLRNQGWTDLSGTSQTLEFRGKQLHLAGTEVPWMGKHPDSVHPDHDFHLLLSHTPDNIRWAARAGYDLILAGHTHGGQIRFPGFGPVYSPSLYGCKYASGIFNYGRSLMHVSRGLSGRHPLRIRCTPEISLILLRSAPVNRD